ncbi:MAG TPA: hydroxymethylbilane synthase [Candidatus Krumholzibacteria bacterium]|nr:hydroxymethylbilane synthase [Candidatus Krumholzibacteria bacterium]
MRPQDTNRLVVGSRKTALAMWQTHHVVAKLRAAWPDLSIEIRTYVTEGDRNLESALPEIGGKGVFTAQLEQALAANEIDFAVHSLKDLPVESDAAFTLGAILSRSDVRDCVVAPNGWTLESLPRGAVVGTSSIRRQAQVLAMRPDVVIKPIRGKVETRVRKVRDGEYDAAILAATGLTRLGLADEIAQMIPADVMVPAPGQGALAVQCRAGDDETRRRLAALDDTGLRAAVTAERTFLLRLGGGCSAPIASHATIANGRIRMTGVVGSPDGKRIIRVEGEGADPIALAELLAGQAMARGAGAILDAFRAVSVASNGGPAGVPGARASVLQGRRVVVTRPREQAAELCEQLQAMGAEPICAAAIRIEPALDLAPLERAIRDIATFDWIVFTSANAVDVVRQRWTAAGKSATDLRVKVAAVGTATAAALDAWGVPVGFIPAEFVGDALARDLPVTPGARVLLPRAEIARRETVEILVARGADVVDIAVYRTVPEEIASGVLADIARGVDAVLFTSESTVKYFMSAIEGRIPAGALAGRARIACIGPVTAGAARAMGLRVDAVASVYTTAGLLDSLAQAFSKGGSTHDQ